MNSIKPTLAVIEALDNGAEDEKRRRKLCIKHNICPECGSPIIRQDYELYDKPKRFLFWTIKGIGWDERRVCSKDKSHYEECWDCPEQY